MQQNKNGRYALPFFLVAFLILSAGTAIAQTPPSVPIGSITTCLAGSGASSVTDALAHMFGGSFSTIGSLVSTTAVYYERVAFALVITLVIIRFTIANATESIDRVFGQMFQSGFGPSVLFAAGLFLATNLASGPASSVIGKMLSGAETFGGTIATQSLNGTANGGKNTSTDTDAAKGLHLLEGLDTGAVGGIMQAGICSAEAVVFGVPPADTGNVVINKIIAAATALVKTIEGLSAGPSGWIIIGVSYLFKIFISLFLLWTITKVAYEVFVIYLIKLIILPLGLVFFAFGQIEFLGFLKESYIHFIVTTLARVLVLSLLLPLVFGIMLAGMVFGSNIALAGGTEGTVGLAVGSFVELFLDFLGVAFLYFFIEHYKDFYEPLVKHHGAGPSGQALGSAVGATMAPVANTMKSAASAIMAAASQIALAAMTGGASAIGTVGASAAGAAASAAANAGSSKASPSAEAGSEPVPPPASSGGSGGTGNTMPLPPPPVAV